MPDLLRGRGFGGRRGASGPATRRVAARVLVAAAHVLSTSTSTIRRLVDEGVLPIVPHMGQRIVIPRAAVMRLVDSAERAGGTERDVRPLRVQSA